MDHSPIAISSDLSPTAAYLVKVLESTRGIRFFSTHNAPAVEAADGLLAHILALSSVLSHAKRLEEAEALKDVHSHCVSPTDFGGLGLSIGGSLDAKEEDEVMFLVTAYMQSLNSADRAKLPTKPLKDRPQGRRSMTLGEKIFAAHDIDRRGEVKPGDVVRVDIDWILASELSWSGMEKTYRELGEPGIFRNDRFWLAGDHLVDPRIKEHPIITPMIEASERARRDFQMTEYQGMNYTIMHTEFSRERAQPGMLVIGSDSHTCSAGSVGALAIGLGVADVTLPLITGETWFKIPESVNINLINRPRPGIGGKDIVLYILKELKRNTVASDRVVEYTGPGLKYLSCDARFAVSNMTTEFGGVTGIFGPDAITEEFINRRKLPKHKNKAVFYRADDDAEYASTHTIDLAKVESFVALYPAPDDVVPVTEVQGKNLDGCFIGSCTTAEEDLILAALVLEQGLKQGKKPVKHGLRKVVPGSRPITHKLRRLGLADIYEVAGFEVGVPGCSYCVGMSADKAGAGETWLSSQNRNFHNRMGKGSFGNLASAATVAASSFDMKITDPKEALNAIDVDRFHRLLGTEADAFALSSIEYVEPGKRTSDLDMADTNRSISTGSVLQSHRVTGHESKHLNPVIANTDPTLAPPHLALPSGPSNQTKIAGKVQTLGDFIDTDALAPNESLHAKTTEEAGAFCLIHTHPDFRRRVKDDGHNIVVAGEAFGCGSSRENAVTTLLGAGVRCVIAKSFGFIYGRNQPNLGLLGITMRDPEFFAVAVDGIGVVIDLDEGVVEVCGRKFRFVLSEIERGLMECGGLSPAFNKWGKALWSIMCEGGKKGGRKGPVEWEAGMEAHKELQW